MRNLAFLGLQDSEVDLLSRARRRKDVTLGAVYHTDPSALIVKLAGLADVPVVSEIDKLLELPIDLCVAGDEAGAMLETIRDEAERAGKSAPPWRERPRICASCSIA